MKILDITGHLLFDTDASGAQLMENTVKEALELAVSQKKSLRRVHLYSQQLREVRLAGAVMTQADLRVANLSGADLSGADLSRADLRMAILLGANLRGANFSGANLRFAILEGADLTDANFEGADITATDREQELISHGIGTGYIMVKKRRNKSSSG